MEEKERYECKYNEKLMKHYTFDNENKEELGYKSVVRVLNQQDKRIKKLEETLEKARQREVIIHQNYRQGYIKDLQELNELQEENQQLKQSQKQLAMDKLEKIKNYFDDSDDDKYNESERWIITNRNVVEYVNNQIKELEGDKK